MFAEIPDFIKSMPMPTVVTGGGAAFVAFLAALAFTNGVMKQIINMVCIGLGISFSWYCLRHRADIFGPSAASMGTDRLVMFSAIAGMIGFGVSRAAMSVLSMVGIFNIFAGMTGWRGMALSLIPSGFMLWASSMGLRLVGNLYGMETAAAMGREGTKITGSFGNVIDEFRRALEKSSIGGVLLNADPLAMRPTANLTRLLIVWPDQKIWTQLVKNEKIDKVFRHQKVIDLGYDKAVRKLIESKDYAGLMQLPKVGETATYPDLQPLLSDVALEEAMDKILYPKPAAPAPAKK